MEYTNFTCENFDKVDNKEFPVTPFVGKESVALYRGEQRRKESVAETVVSTLYPDETVTIESSTVLSHQEA